MDKKDCLTFCHYYNGEDVCPFTENDKRMLWHVERSWVLDTVSICKDDADGGSELDEYIGYGLDGFKNMDGMPITLKARLLNRFAKGFYSMANAVAPFKTFYNKYY